MKLFIFFFFLFIQMSCAMEWTGDPTRLSSPREAGYVSPPLSPKGVVPPSQEWLLRNIYAERLQKWHEAQETLQRQIETALKARPDVLARTKASIDRTKREHDLPAHFVGELDELLDTLKPPEEMFSTEERRALLDCQTCIDFNRDLKPIHDAIKTLKTFIKQYEGFIAFLTILEQVLDHVPKCEKEWTNLAQTMGREINGKYLTKESALAAFEIVKFCNKYSRDLTQSLEDLRQDHNRPQPYIRNTLEHLEETTRFICTYLDKIATNLWVILAPAIPLGEQEERSQKYSEIPETYFHKSNHPLKAYLLQQVDGTQFNVEELGHATSRTLVSPRLTEILSPIRPISAPPLPVSPISKITTPRRSSFPDFGRKFKQQVFEIPAEWESNKGSFKKDFSSLAKAIFVLEDLEKLKSFYNEFLIDFKKDQQNVGDMLYSKARVCRPGCPVFLSSQHLTRGVCGLITNGFFCWQKTDFGMKRPGPLGNVTILEDLRFSVSSYEDQIMMGEDPIESTFLSLFNLRRDPISTFLGKLLTYQHKSNVKSNITNLTTDIMDNPADWALKPTTIRVTVLPKEPKQTLKSLLEEIKRGERSFNSLDQHSQGSWILYNILTRGMVTEDSMGLEERDGSYHLKRIYSDPFFNPLFGKTLGNQFQFLGRNLLYLLPLFVQPIARDVKQEFLSHDIPLILSLLHGELDSINKNYQNFCTDNSLTEPYPDEEFSEHSQTYAQIYGYTVSTRSELIETLIRNYRLMAHRLSTDEPITYRDLLNEVRPYEAIIYKEITRKGESEVDLMPLFFQTLMPRVFRQLDKGFKKDPNLFRYTIDELRLFKEAAKQFSIRIQEISARIEFPKQSKRAKKTHVGNLQYEIEGLDRKRRSLEEAAKEAEAKKQALREIADELLRVEDGEERMPSEIPNNDSYSEKLAAIESIIEKNNQDIQKTEAEIEDLQKSIETDQVLISPESLFNSWAPQEGVEPKAISFFKERLKVAQAHGVFQAAAILEALGGFGGEDPLVYDCIPGNPTETVPCLSEVSQFHHFFEATHTVENMRVELTRCVDSVKTPTKDQEQRLEEAQLARAQRYLLATVSAQSKQAAAGEIPGLLFHNLCFEKQEWDAFHMSFFQAISELIMLPRYSYQCEEAATTKSALNLKNREAVISKRIVSIEGDFVVEELEFPDIVHCGDSIGDTRNPWGKGGPIAKELKGGEHYLRTFSEIWVRLFQDERPLCSKARNLLTSHALPLLLLSWSNHLRKLDSQITFHPWFIENLIEKSQELLSFVSLHETVLFRDILRELHPEIYFVLESRFGSNKTAHDIIKMYWDENGRLIERTPSARGLHAIEQKGTSLNWRAGPDKPNMTDLLSRWDKTQEANEGATPLNLADVVAAILNSCTPNAYSLTFIIRLLESAHTQEVNFARIITGNWTSPGLLRDIKAQGASIAIIEFLASLRVRSKVTVKHAVGDDGPCLTISNLDATNPPGLVLLIELLTLFPDDITCLNLGHNNIGSLRPLSETLKRFKGLRELQFNDNPLHNLQLLAELPSGLEKINLSNTPTPPPSLEDSEHQQIDKLRSLTTSPFKPVNKVTSLPNLRHYVNMCMGKDNPLRGDRFQSQTPQALLTLFRDCMAEDAADPLLRVSILETLAERNWQTVLDPANKKNIQWIKDNAGLVLKKLKEDDQEPRASAFRLLFAITHGLPRGTDPNCLIFESLNNEAGDLRQIKICEMEQAPNLSCLAPFVSLTHLSLCSLHLTTLDDLPALPCLQFLDLSDNGITTLDGLCDGTQQVKFPNLRDFNVENNAIKSGDGRTMITPLTALGTLKQLKKLNIKRNYLISAPKLRGVNIDANPQKKDQRK